MTIACEASIRMAKRYAKLTRELAQEENDKVRKGELERIAGICDWVPANPAENLSRGPSKFLVCSPHHSSRSSVKFTIAREI